MRTLFTLLALSLAATPALAANPELKEAKQGYTEAKKERKEFQGIRKLWEKGYAKENDKLLDKADGKLKAFRQEELDEVRAAGVPTREVGQDVGKPGVERLRDVLVELRELQVRFEKDRAGAGAFQKKSGLLADLEELLVASEARHKHRIDVLKGKK